MTADEQLEWLARTCSTMGSPFCAAWLREAARDYREGGALRAFLHEDPARLRTERIGLHLMGALQFSAFEGTAPALAAHLPSCGGDGDAVAAWTASQALLETHAAELYNVYDRTPQTNEVARAMPLSAALLEAVAAVGKPVALYDLGASAGLNLQLDRFHYRSDGWEWGDPSSVLTLQNHTRSGKPRHLDVRPVVVARAGCDIHPLDAGNERDCNLLRAYVWADQPERFERLDGALGIARTENTRVDRADFREWVPQRATPRDGILGVIMHSVVTEHLPHDVKAGMTAAIEAACVRATPSAPMAWIRMEPVLLGRYETRVAVPTHDLDMAVAICDGHARETDWIAA